jgi:ribonuclease P protein component
VARVRGKPLHLQGFKVFYSLNKSRKDYRMAVVVSKKTAKFAVTRNRIRRRLYEAVRKNGTINNQQVDMVFVVQDSGLATQDWQDLYTQVEKALKKIIDHS